MKKLRKNALLASTLLLFSLCSCGNAEQGNSSSSPFSSSEEEKAEPTGHYLIENGASDYTIVIPDGADANVSFASSELQYFIELSAGITLPIVSDATLTSLKGRYISLGQTSIFENYELTIPENLGKTGYVLKTQDEALLINSRDGTGVYSGVYDYLADAINLEIYASDEYTYDAVSSIPLLDYDVKFTPFFDIREVILKHVSTSTLYKRRMRLNTTLAKGSWAAFAHTTITKYLPYSTYGTEHPDWYSSGGTQVCYSNSEVLNAIAERMKECIIDNPEATFIQMGHEDNLDMCDCSNCVAEREKYGGYSGQELEFTNKLEEILDPWLEKNYPERSMKYVFFAYQTSQDAPAQYDEATGKYVPTSSSFRINENVMVMYCPVDADFSKKMSDSKNATQYKQIKAWSDLFDYAGIKDGIYVWTYSLSALSAMVPLNNFGIYEDHYKFFRECGVKYIMDQSYNDTGTPSLEALKVYTQARLQYSQKESYETLAAKFLNQYYGDARKPMIEYYNLLRSHYKYLEETQGVGGYVKSQLYNEDYWSFEILNTFFSLMEEGIECISPLKESDPSRYATLLTRLRTEECFPIYMFFRFYMSELSHEQQENYWQILSEYCNKAGIVCSAESANDMNSQLETWRVSIFGE